MSEDWFKKRFAFLMVGTLVALLPATLMYVDGKLSARGFALVFVLILVAFIAMLWSWLIKVRDANRQLAADHAYVPDVKTRRRLKRQILQFRIFLVILPILLVYGLWDTRDTPLLPRLAAAAINLLITMAIFVGMKNIQARLEKPGEPS